MLSLRKPSAESINRFLAAQARLDFTYSALGATATRPPAGYVVDHTRIKLGEGEPVFQAAVTALRRWEQFRLGWLQAWPAETPLRTGEVVAVELDANLLSPLRSILAPYDNVRLIHGDILKLAPGEVIDQANYIVVANIPYYITSAVIRHLLESDKKPRRIVLTVQREVARRICAKPGEMSLLALSVQVYGEPRIAARIPAGAFFPAPKVDSAVLRVDIYPSPRIPPELVDRFFQLIKAGFSQKRKTLRNALASGLRRSPSEAEALLARANIDPQRRAETLRMEEWETLSKSM